MKLLNAMVAVGLIITSLFLLLIVGGPLFSGIEPALILANPTGAPAGRTVDLVGMITKVNFVIFRVVPLVMLAAGIYMVIMGIFWEEYQTYEYQ